MIRNKNNERIIRGISEVHEAEIWADKLTTDFANEAVENYRNKTTKTLDIDEKSSADNAADDFWNFGYADYNLSIDEGTFDQLDSDVVKEIFKAGWNQALTSLKTQL